MGLISEGVDLLNLVDKARNADLYKELGEWIEKVRELQRRNGVLESELTDLKAKVSFIGRIERISGHTFVEGDEEEICSRCAEVDRRAVHFVPGMVDGRGKWSVCPECKAPARGWKRATRQSLQGQST
jgi:hypothetical protein